MNRTIQSALILTVALAASVARADVRAFKVTTDKTIDSTSLESIVKQVTERAGAKTNDEKAIAIYEYLHNTIFHWAYPTEVAPQSVGPLKVLNAYGWGLCGGQHTVLKALYETAGWQCRYVGWPGHTTVEVKYDDKWHYFDVFLKCYFWSKDKSHVVSQEEIAADPSLVLDAVKDGRAARQNLCCGDEAEGVVEGCTKRNVVGDSKGWASVTWRDENYSPLLNLPAGASVRLDWKADPNGFAITGKAPQHSCGTKDIRSDSVLGPILEHYGPRNWSDGQLIYAPDFAKPAALADIELTSAKAEGGKLVPAGAKGTATFKLPLPYPYVTAKITSAGKCSISTDKGKTWKPADADVTTLVKQKYDLWIKVEFTEPLAAFRLEATVEHNRGAQPYLMNGKNSITVSAAGDKLPDGAGLVVTYSFQEATVANPEKRTRWDAQGVKYGPVRTITKEVAKLPFTFDIEVGGNTPPKMLSLERSVGGK